MTGLRLYVKPISAEGAARDAVFYSRRGGGPFYCWCFEVDLGRWKGSRMQVCDLAVGDLSLACWRTVPIGLQVRLNEHYME